VPKEDSEEEKCNWERRAWQRRKQLDDEELVDVIRLAKEEDGEELIPPGYSNRSLSRWSHAIIA
jgi:hypothetical protein